MRHKKAGLKLNRTSSHRDAMFRNMVTSLFKYDRIRTTTTKAKELIRLSDHVVTLAKRGGLHARRQVLSIISDKKIVQKIFDEAAERFGSVSGGYAKTFKIGRRSGDAAPLSLVELVFIEKSKNKVTKKEVKVEESVKEIPKKQDEDTISSAEPIKEIQSEEPKDLKGDIKPE